MGVYRNFPYSNFHEMNMDELIKIVRELADDWVEYQLKWDNLYDDTAQALADFKTYVANYFSNLDVQDEINRKLDAMLGTGKFDPIIKTQLSPVVTDWLDENITLTEGVTIDSSLSIAGACADAKATGDAITNVANLAKRLYTIHQYNFLQYDFINGFYNSSGQIVSHATIKSYIVPIRNKETKFYCNINTSLALLDAGKNFIALAPKSSVSNNVVGSTVSVNSYLFDAENYPNAAFITIPYSGGVAYLRSASENRMIPILPINSDGSCEDIELIFNDNTLIYPYNFGNLGGFTSGFMNIGTGEMMSDAERYKTNIVYLKKGTKISTKYSNIAFVLRGITGSNIFIGDIINQEVTMGADFVGTIDFKEYGWVHPGYAPQNFTGAKLSDFFIIVTPEDSNTNKWNGKTWYCYGTSLSDIGIDDTEGNNGLAGKYPLYLDTLSGMIRHNEAIGSGGIRTNASHGGNVLQRLLNCPFDVDLVTLECLPNDGYDSEANVGTINDTGTTTICGAFKTACEYITQHTRAKMIVLFIGGGVYSTDPMNTDHIKYIEAKEKLKEIADMYGVTYIDAEKDAINWKHKADVGCTMIDTIHYNYLGGLIIGRYVWSKLRNIDPYPVFSNIA